MLNLLYVYSRQTLKKNNYCAELVHLNVFNSTVMAKDYLGKFIERHLKHIYDTTCISANVFIWRQFPDSGRTTSQMYSQENSSQRHETDGNKMKKQYCSSWTDFVKPWFIRQATCFITLWGETSEKNNVLASRSNWRSICKGTRFQIPSSQSEATKSTYWEVCSVFGPSKLRKYSLKGQNLYSAASDDSKVNIETLILQTRNTTIQKSQARQQIVAFLPPFLFHDYEKWRLDITSRGLELNDENIAIFDWKTQLLSRIN